MHLAVIGIAAALGVGANATPALASDGLDPAPLAEAVGAEGIPAIGELEVDEAVPVPEPPIAIDTSIEDGDLDVSVRILSPAGDGVEGPAGDGVEAPVEAASDLISGALEPDITVDPVMPDASPAAADPVGQDIVNTNVSVRVLSPGDDGPVAQESGLAAAGPDDPRPDAAPADALERELTMEDLGEAPEDTPQYHGDNIQYQSDSIPDADPWVWEWHLALDCSGITTSTSSEIGDPDSRDWDWNWTWDWTCGFDGASEESGDALQEGFASVASVNGGTATASPASPASEPITATGEQPGASAAPWLWTWTFNFCGRETTFSIEAGAQTSLQWTWDWTWAWACTSAEVVAPATGGEGPSGPAADTGAPSGTLELPPPLAIVTAPFLAGPLLATPSPGTTLPWTPRVVVTPGPISAAIPLGLGPSTGSGPEHAPASGPGPPQAQAPAPVSTAGAGDLATASPDSARDERARPTKSRDHDASPRPARRLPQLPLGPARRAAGSATSSGGAAPGGGAVSGFAALTGFYILAAPGLGRRLRDVRELSPHARAEAPLDRPG